MINVREIKGAIFDVDDTLLDNRVEGGGTLHERSRFVALQQAAEKYDLPALRTVTHEENLNAFLDAKVHSLAGAVWIVLFQKGIVASDQLDPNHPLLQEIVASKNELHAEILRQHGKIVLGAVELVHVLGEEYGLADEMAVASSAVRRDIDIFFDEMTDLRQFFPSKRVIAYEDIPHGMGKPHPEPFDRAFKTLNLPDSDRRSVLAFEDDPRGIISAKKAGLYVCAITTRFPRNHPQLIAAQPDFIIDDYTEFITQLSK